MFLLGFAGCEDRNDLVVGFIRVVHRDRDSFLKLARES